MYTNLDGWACENLAFLLCRWRVAHDDGDLDDDGDRDDDHVGLSRRNLGGD